MNNKRIQNENKTTKTNIYIYENSEGTCEIHKKKQLTNITKTKNLKIDKTLNNYKTLKTNNT